jgi:hypothetical protein
LVAPNALSTNLNSSDRNPIISVNKALVLNAIRSFKNVIQKIDKSGEIIATADRASQKKKKCELLLG